MIEQINELLSLQEKSIIADTQAFVKVKSVQGDSGPGMPFGKGPNDALEHILELSSSMGFRVKNIDGYAGYAEFGEGDETLGILAHVDVVPEGSDWTYPPYAAVIHEGRIYGRGSVDDKGPIIAVLHGMKAIKDSNIPLKKRVRLVFGTDEETGMESIKYYLSKEKPFEYGFTPDAEFPVINGEKGILNIKLESTPGSHNDSAIRIVSVVGGDAINSVPDKCTAVIRVEECLKKEVQQRVEEYMNKSNNMIKVEDRNDELILSCTGKSAHASTPNEGVNAATIMLQCLGQLHFEKNNIVEFIKDFNKKIGMEIRGEALNCELWDKMSGALSLNVGVVDIKEDQAKVLIDIRYPVSGNSDEIVKHIEGAFEGTKTLVEVIDHEGPVFIPENHFLIKKLMSVYSEITGDYDTKPIVIGGGTYARAMKNIVAFGPVFPYEQELAHQKDEYIEINSLIKAAQIYTKAIYELAK